MNTVVRALFTVLTFSAGASFGEEINVGGVLIEIPAPVGYTSISKQAELFSVWQQDTDPTARLLAGFMSDRDYKSWIESQDFDYGNYNAMVEVDKAMEKFPATPDILTRLQSRTQMQMETTMPNAFVVSETGLARLNPSLKPEDYAFAGIEAANSSFYMILLGYDPSGGHLLNAEGQVLVRGRIIGIAVEAYYRSDDDLEWLQDTVQTWMDSIVSANKQ